MNIHETIIAPSEMTFRGETDPGVPREIVRL